ncbi:MAG: hypothetical protein RL137_1634, partial [Bacteroidota bacterium]
DLNDAQVQTVITAVCTSVEMILG